MSLIQHFFFIVCLCFVGAVLYITLNRSISKMDAISVFHFSLFELKQ